MLSLHTLLHDLIIIYDPATTETYTLSLHDALPIYQRAGGAGGAGRREGRRHAGRPLAPQGDRGARPPGQRGGLTSGNPGWTWAAGPPARGGSARDRRERLVHREIGRASWRERG